MCCAHHDDVAMCLCPAPPNQMQMVKNQSTNYKNGKYKQWHRAKRDQMEHMKLATQYRPPHNTAHTFSSHNANKYNYKKNAIL